MSATVAEWPVSKGLVTVSIVRDRGTSEWIVKTSVDHELTGSYFTEDRRDAIATRDHIVKAYLDRGFDVDWQVKFK